MSAFIPGAATAPFGLNLLETYFGPVCDSFAEARTADHYRALGETLRQLLFDFAQAAHAADPEHILLPDAGLEQWPEAVAATVLTGEADGARRSVFVAQLTSAWIAANALAADPHAGRGDTETAMYLCCYAIEFGTHVVGRYLQPRPDVCPNCGGPHLTVADERARCLDCGWYSAG